MKITLRPTLFLATLLAGAATGTFAAEEPELVPPRPRPNVQELRQRGRLLSPEERQKLIRESMERRGITNWAELQKRREELRNLTPEERQAYFRGLRENPEKLRPGFRVLSPEERQTKRKQLGERVAAQIKLLEEKQKDGTMTEPERRRLERMRELATKLERGQVLGPRGGAAAPEKPTDALPPPAPVKPGTNQ